MTTAELAAIRARADAATPGPWEKDYRGGGAIHGGEVVEFVRGSSTTQVALATGLHEQVSGTQDANAEFVAHARADASAVVHMRVGDCVQEVNFVDWRPAAPAREEPK